MSKIYEDNSPSIGTTPRIKRPDGAERYLSTALFEGI